MTTTEESFAALDHLIAFFDRLLALVGVREFEGFMLSEWRGMGDNGAGGFTVTLEIDALVAVDASVNPRGELKAMVATRHDGRGISAVRDLTPDSGLWVAVAAWFLEFEATWHDDEDFDGGGEGDG